MTSALDWLEPSAPPLFTAAATGEPGLAGVRYDGLVSATPEDSVAAADLLSGPEGRAATVRSLLPPGGALARAVAVWVHTGRLRPRRTDVVVPTHLRVNTAAVVHRQRLAAADVVRVGGVPTTTPLRTAVDLLCFVEPASAAAGFTALVGQGLSPAAVREVLQRRRGRVPARRALALLDRVAADRRRP